LVKSLSNSSDDAEAKQTAFGYKLAKETGSRTDIHTGESTDKIVNVTVSFVLVLQQAAIFLLNLIFEALQQL